MLGFTDDELKDLDIDFDGEDLPELDETKADEVPEVEETPVIKRGDIIELGNHRLMCGDSTSIDAVEKLMDGEKAHLLHTDPPYGVSYDGKGGSKKWARSRTMRWWAMASWTSSWLHSTPRARCYAIQPRGTSGMATRAPSSSTRRCVSQARSPVPRSCGSRTASARCGATTGRSTNARST